MEAEKEHCLESCRERLRQALCDREKLQDDSVNCNSDEGDGRQRFGASSGRRTDDMETWW